MNYLTGVGKATQIHKTIKHNTKSSKYSEKKKIKVSQIEVSLCLLTIFPAKEKLLPFNPRAGRHQGLGNPNRRHGLPFKNDVKAEGRNEKN